MELTEKQGQVMSILGRGSPTGLGPTEIGQRAGKPYQTASAWAHGALKVLVKRGLVARSVNAYGRVCYRRVERGRI